MLGPQPVNGAVIGMRYDQEFTTLRYLELELAPWNVHKEAYIKSQAPLELYQELKESHDRLSLCKINSDTIGNVSSLCERNFGVCDTSRTDCYVLEEDIQKVFGIESVSQNNLNSILDKYETQKLKQ
jgi:hypothetical protein